MTRSANEPDLVLRYGDDAEHVIDVRLPAAPDAAAAGPAPTVVILHGGFWRAPFDRIHTRPMADALTEVGFVTVTPEYRRTGQAGGGWPGTLEDVGAALDALPSLLSAAAPGRADLSRVVLTGHSAGGQLALWAASRRVGSTALRVNGVVALAPVADLVTADRIDLDDDAVRLLLGGSHTAVPDRYAYADPVQLVPIGVRMIVLHGTADPWVPLEQSQAFVAAAASAGDDVVLTELPGQDHYALIDPLSAAWPQVLAALSSFG
ncbi:MAG: alpha/beta hydrolase family protein [Actinomycetes bacterium]